MHVRMVGRHNSVPPASLPLKRYLCYWVPISPLRSIHMSRFSFHAQLFFRTASGFGMKRRLCIYRSFADLLHSGSKGFCTFSCFLTLLDGKAWGLVGRYKENSGGRSKRKNLLGSSPRKRQNLNIRHTIVRRVEFF
jgi:hypothetical protein